MVETSFDNTSIILQYINISIIHIIQLNSYSIIAHQIVHQIITHQIIYYNSPNKDDGEEYKTWIREVAKIWNNKRNRNYKCDKLDRLSGKLVDIDND